ncbi:helix-turn-helix domain-containing protein [Streptomyces avermitilis]|uniref:winged helix-turn-helix transcriptional regulator n=1 Tax=Streptomyces avermitilis TaxID=33903 RepID=UPI0033B5D8EA
MRTDDCLPSAADRILAGVRDVFSDVADKWAFLIIDVLGERTLRCGELRKKIEGISHKMVTQNLRMLERNGLVERSVHPTVPPHVEYTLTEPGQALRVTVHRMSRTSLGRFVGRYGRESGDRAGAGEA